MVSTAVNCDVIKEVFSSRENSTGTRGADLPNTQSNTQKRKRAAEATLPWVWSCLQTRDCFSTFRRQKRLTTRAAPSQNHPFHCLHQRPKSH